MTHLRGAWLQQWTWGPPYAAEQSLDDAIALCRQYGLAGLAVKAFDGQTWMGAIDPAEDALRNVNQVREQRQRCETAGLAYAIWTNPLHGSRDFLEQQAGLYAAAGNAAGMVWWDTEPYEHFWGANRPEGDAWWFMEHFRAAAPNVVNVWQPDPRPARLAELRPDEWAPWMNVYAPQTYWTDFEQPPEECLVMAYTPEATWWRRDLEFAPTLPGNAPSGEIERALDALGDLGSEGCAVWRMGSAGPEQLAVFRDNPLYMEPPDSCAAQDRKLAAVQALLDRKGAITRAALRAALAT